MGDDRETPADDGCKLFIGNITYNTGDRELRELFEKYGTVKEARVAVDAMNGRSRGFGFVTMETSDEANEAVKNVTGMMIDGREVRVEVSHGRGGNGGGRAGGGGGRGYEDRRRDDRGGSDRRAGGGSDYRPRERRGDDRDGGDRYASRADRGAGDRYNRSSDDRGYGRDRGSDHRSGGGDRRSDGGRRDRSRDR